MKRVINLTPHGVQVFRADQFVNLEQVNPTTLVADAVIGDPVADFPTSGVARINTKTVERENNLLPGEVVTTEYGRASGIPADATAEDVLIVSLPMQSMARAAGHPLAPAMVAPYKVVRSRQNGSLVLGCMGFTF